MTVTIDSTALMREIVADARDLITDISQDVQDPAAMDRETLLAVLAVTAEALAEVLRAEALLYEKRNELYYAARMRRDRIDIKELARVSLVTANTASVAINKITSQKQ